ncbi:MAG: ParB/RepB/Spo0J family partition protein [Rickettsiales bacterium]
MKQEKRALGKGLSALLSNVDLDANHNNDNSTQVVELEVDLISPNPNQPRKNFSDLELNELAASIKSFGILQPIIVVKVNDSYQLVAGERRLRAAKLAGLAKIPSLVKDLEAQESFELALIENLQRENLNPMEEAIAYDKLMTSYNYTQLELSTKIGKSRSYIANTLRLLNLDNEIKSKLMDGKISAGHARAILKSSEPQKLTDQIIQQNLSVRDAERLSKTRNLSHFDHAQKHPVTRDHDLLEIEEMLTTKLGIKVQVKDTPRGGQVIINFNSLEELDGIIQLLAA